MTETDLVAVETKTGLTALKAVSVLERIPRSSITEARIDTAGMLAVLVIRIGDETQWVFEVQRGVPSKRCAKVVEALGF